MKLSKMLLGIGGSLEGSRGFHGKEQDGVLIAQIVQATRLAVELEHRLNLLEWVPVAEHLPPLNTLVQITNTAWPPVTVGTLKQWHHALHWIDIIGGPLCAPPTHWAPLLVPPQKG